MSFSVKEEKELRIKADHRPRINLCGDCGQAVGETELLCEVCRHQTETRWESVEETELRAAWKQRKGSK